MAEGPFRHTFVIPSGASVSDALNVGLHVDPSVPASVVFPSNLNSMVRLTFEVSLDNLTWYPQLFNTHLMYITGTTSSMDMVSDPVQQACIGWEYIRLKSLDGSSAAQNVSADTSVIVTFVPLAIDNASIIDPHAPTA